VWVNLRGPETGIGGAYMIGRRPSSTPPPEGTTRSGGSPRERGAMPFTSFSCARLMWCLRAIDSSVSPFFGV